MKRSGTTLLLCVALVGLSALAPLAAQPDRNRAPRPQLGGDRDTVGEPLMRGPVHEAFAEPVIFDPEPGLKAPKAPPEAVEEVPPDQRPEGDNVVWISGYWGWDDDRKDFIWISGIWRTVPPGRDWVAGYWTQADGGHQWVSGFWSAADSRNVVYLPEPPESLENGPPSDPPSVDQTWSPGTWVYRESRYAWRPGFWVAHRPDWVWTQGQRTSIAL